MKRRALTIAGVCVALVVGVAAPALSLRPYRPAPVDFELVPASRDGAVARSAWRGKGLVSRPLRAPKRFNVVGLRWRGGAEAAIAMRVRKNGGRWSPWKAVAAEPADAPDPRSGEPSGAGSSAPVWAGEADVVQYRLSRPLPGLRLHFVNSTGTATASARARTGIRRLANRGLLAAAGLASADAQSPMPPIVPRARWGADDCQPRTDPEYGEVKAAFIHHTVTLNDYTPEQAPAAVLGICRYHRNSNGWNDIGYNFLVDKYGTIYEGRAGGVDKAVIGAQAQGYNSQTTGIANLGTFIAVPQAEPALAAMARLIRWKLPLHGQPTAGSILVTSAGGSSNRYPSGTEVQLERVAGHRDGDATSCPGDALYAQLPDLRARVGSVEPRQARTRIEATVRPGVLRFPASTQMTGRVRLLKGAPVGGAPVEVQQFDDAAWQTVAQTTAAADGSFNATVAVTGNRIVRARFPGNGSLTASTSRQSKVKVRAAITTTVRPPRVAVGQTALFSGSVQPGKGRVLGILQRRVRSRNRRIAAVSIRTRSGRFQKAFRLRRPGLYRFYASFPGDRLNLAAVSQPLYLRAVRGRGGSPGPPGRTRRRG